jgi:spoIIIJ-associated protein
MTEATAQTVKGILEKILELLEMAGTVNVSSDGTTVLAEISVQDPGMLIGKAGRGLQALQYLVQRIAGRAAGEARLPPIVVDVGGYRKQREEELSLMAKEIAARVRGSGNSVLLGPMSAWERKIVHMAVRDREGLESESEDSDAGRRVRIRSKTNASPPGEPGGSPDTRAG